MCHLRKRHHRGKKEEHAVHKGTQLGKFLSQPQRITAAEILIRMLPYNYIHSAFLFLIFYNGFPAIPVFTRLTNSVNCKGNGIVVVKTR